MGFKGANYQIRRSAYKKKGLAILRDDSQLISNEKPLTEQLGKCFI